MKNTTLLLSLTLACGVAFAEQPAPAAVVAEAKLAEAPKSKLICTNEKVTGSRFTKRVCLSKEDSDRLKEEGVEAVKRIQRMPIPIVSE